MGTSAGRRTGDAVASGGLGFSPRAEAVLVTAAALALTVALVSAATLHAQFATLAAMVALYVAALAVLGRDRMAAATMMAALFTAPFFKSLNPAAAITPTDLLIGAAAVLFVPTLLTRSVRFPLTYWAGVAIIIVTVLVASAASEQAVTSLIRLVQWVTVLIGLPLLYVLWRPSARMIRALLWSYVAGHMLSTFSALLSSPLPNGRYDGLTHHPNAFAEAGLMSIAILLYLFHEHRSVRSRVVIAVAAAVSFQSILMSGSRSAAVVLAVVLMAIPIVERSALWGFALAMAAGLAVAVLPWVAGASGESSALARLQGTGDALVADEHRESANQIAWRLFSEQPLLGHGYLDVLIPVHNNYILVGAVAGIFAVVGYLMVLGTFLRPLVGSAPHRRLCYMVLAYVGLQAALPSLWDRTAWVPMALAALAVVHHQERRQQSISRPAANRWSRPVDLPGS